LLLPGGTAATAGTCLILLAGVQLPFSRLKSTLFNLFSRLQRAGTACLQAGQAAFLAGCKAD